MPSSNDKDTISRAAGFKRSSILDERPDEEPPKLRKQRRVPREKRGTPVTGGAGSSLPGRPDLQHHRCPIQPPWRALPCGHKCEPRSVPYIDARAFARRRRSCGIYATLAASTGLAVGFGSRATLGRIKLVLSPPWTGSPAPPCWTDSTISFAALPL